MFNMGLRQNALQELFQRAVTVFTLDSQSKTDIIYIVTRFVYLPVTTRLISPIYFFILQNVFTCTFLFLRLRPSPS